MKRYLVIGVAAAFFLGVIGFSYTHLVGPNEAHACGWGKSGGGDYVPQERGSDQSRLGSLYDKFTGNSKAYASSSLTKEQAYDVISTHIKKLNPSLEVGEIKDSGRFYEAEILSEDKAVVERLAVDKQSGRIMPIL